MKFKSIYSRFLRKIIPSRMKNALYEFKIREKKCSFGNENPDKVFYVIGRDDLGGGLWCIINNALMNLAKCEEYGYIPIIDYKNHKTYYTSNNDFDGVNFWERIFLPPSNYSIDDIMMSKHVIIAKNSFCPDMKYLMGDFFEDEGRLTQWKNLFQKYIKFNDQTKKEFEKRINELLGGSKCVGCLVRGTDYVLRKPKNHPVQPNPEDVIKKCKEVMRDYSCTKVFLATEDADILDLFQREFGTTLLYLDQPRISKKDMDENNFLALNKDRLLNNIDKFKDAVDYLFATYTLSRCNCFVSGKTGGAKGVLMMNDKFEYKYIFNLGMY